jgi:hypothetical protein
MNKRLKALLLGASLLLAGCNNKESLQTIDVFPLYLECQSVEDLNSYIKGVKFSEPYYIYLPSNLESLDIISIYTFTPVSASKYLPNPYLPVIWKVYVKYQIADDNVSSISAVFNAKEGEVAGSINIVSKTPNVENYSRVLQMNYDVNSTNDYENMTTLYKNTLEVASTVILFKDDVTKEIKSNLKQQINNELSNSLVPYKI